MKRRLFQGLLIGLVCACIALALHFTGYLTWLENPIWGWRVKMFKQKSPSTDKIKLIMIDQPSLSWGKNVNRWRWPWPREIHGYIIDFCKRGGAKAVIVDLTFTESSSFGPSDDAMFGDIVRSNRNSALAFAVNNDNSGLNYWPHTIQANSTIPEVKGIKSSARMNTAFITKKNAEFPVDEILTNCPFIGNISIIDEADSVIRRITPYSVFDGRFVPCLALAGFLAGNSNAIISLSGQQLTVECGGQPSAVIPIDNRGQTILKYRGESLTHHNYSAKSILQSEFDIQNNVKPQIDPLEFKDCYVLYGSSATALFDLKSSPISEVYPGVEINATILDNLLANDFIRDTNTNTSILVVVILSILAGIIGRSCSNGSQSVAAFVILIPLTLVPAFAAYPAGYWLPAGSCVIAVLLSLTAALIVNYATEGRQKRFIKNAFKQFVSHEVVDELTASPDRLKLGGEAKVISIYFSDIQGFTTISESLTSEKLTQLLNEYLTEMTNVIYSEKGTVDKYIGDAIVAFWNAPLDQADHAIRAVRTAIRCQKRLDEIRPALKEISNHNLYCRIGINTGTVNIGNMGSNQRFNYTFLGDAGNLASRLEGINKKFGTFIIISEFTRKLIGDEIAARELGKVKVVGKSEPIRIYEPMLPEDYSAKADIYETFSEALDLFYKGDFEEASVTFETISRDDRAADKYLGICEDMIKNPPDEWDGILDIKEK